MSDPDYHPAAVEIAETSTSEQVILGTILDQGATWPDIEPNIAGADFNQPIHESIWNACAVVYAAGNIPDPATVRVALGSEAFRLPGGPAYLHTLMQYATWGANAAAVARDVAQLAVRRRLRAVANGLMQAVDNPDLTVSQLTERAISLIDQATASTTTSTQRTTAEIVESVIDAAENGTITALSTPWVDLDRHIVGLRPGRLYVVGARPGVGKSLVVKDIAKWVAKTHGQMAYLATLEMGANEVMQRMLADEAQVVLSKIESGGTALSEHEWQRLAPAAMLAAELPIHIDERSTLTIHQIRTRVRDLQRRNTVGVVCIDYIGLLKVDRSKSRQEALAEVSSAAKNMARELDVPVILVSQLNRNSVINGRQTPPNLTDLRESGSIEQDADVVLLMHDEVDDQGDPTGTVLLNVAKQRNGPTGTVHLSKQGHYARLMSAARRDY